MEKKEVLGVDIGGVILDFVPYFDTELDFRGENYLATPEIEGAIDSLTLLNAGRFKNSVFLVSKVDERGPDRVISWLRHHEFSERTGIPEERFSFCTERDAKAPICKDLSVTHFVDDRAEVLSHMVGIVPYLYAFRSLDEKGKDFSTIESHLQRFNTWKELFAQLS